MPRKQSHPSTQQLVSKAALATQTGRADLGARYIVAILHTKLLHAAHIVGMDQLVD
jgi:hypothetical protein